MPYELFKYSEPALEQEPFISAPDIKTRPVVMKGVAPENYHATTIFPEYFKIKGKWVLAKESRMDSVVVIKEDGEPEIKEFRNLDIGQENCS